MTHDSGRTPRPLAWCVGLFAVGMVGAVLGNAASALAEIRDELLSYDMASPCASFEQAADHLREAQDRTLQSQQQDTNLLLMQELGNFGQAMSKQFSKQCDPLSGNCVRDMDYANQRAQSHYQQRQAGRDLDMSRVNAKLDELRFEQGQCEDTVNHFLSRLREARGH